MLPRPRGISSTHDNLDRPREARRRERQRGRSSDTQRVQLSRESCVLWGQVLRGPYAQQRDVQDRKVSVPTDSRGSFGPSVFSPACRVDHSSIRGRRRGHPNSFDGRWIVGRAPRPAGPSTLRGTVGSWARRDVASNGGDTGDGVRVGREDRVAPCFISVAPGPRNRP